MNPLRPEALRRALTSLGIPPDQHDADALKRLLPHDLRTNISSTDPEVVGELVVHWARNGLVILPTAPAAAAIQRMSNGTHSCHVYRDVEDLVEIAVPWIRTGLDARQYCLWIIPESLGLRKATQVLSLAIADLQESTARKQLELVSSRDWYFETGGEPKSDAMMGAAWSEKVNSALSAGFAGVRAVGDMSWISTQPDLERFIRYEKRCDEAAPDLPLAGLCTYHVDSLPKKALERIVEAHQRCFVKTDQVWHRIEARDEAGSAVEALRRARPAKNDERVSRPTFAGRPFPPNRHVCAFFRNPQEQFGQLLPFIKEGLERGEKAVHVVKRSDHDDHLQRLKSAGVDVERAISIGQLELLDWEKTYLRNGRFNLNEMPALIEGLIARSRSEGYPLLRYVGNMEWSLENRPGVEDVLEYESKLHLLLPKYPDPVLCCYSIGQYTAEFVFDMLRVHQTAIVCGILNENPYFVPPQDYLRERRAAN